MPQTQLRVVKSKEESGLGNPLPIKLSRIERFAEQPRRYFNPKSLEELADSIQHEGQQTPVRVGRHETKPGTFVLVGGERRWRAFGIIRDRTGTDPLVLAFVDLNHDAKHHFREAFLDNLHREDLVPIDEAAAYHRLRTKEGMTIREIAALRKRSDAHIENYLKVHTLPDAVKALMDPALPRERQLTITAAIEIARSVSDPNLQLTLARESIERNLSTAETRMLISVWTGRSGYGIGGRLRKPSDDYKVFTGFLGRTLAASKRFWEGLDLKTMYLYRDDERGDRQKDAATLRKIIKLLQQQLAKIEEET